MSFRSDPRRREYVLSLASKQLQRFELSNQREDLDNSISHFTELILLPPHSWHQNGTIIALYSLAHALSTRSEVSNQPEDAIYATKYLFHLRDQLHEIPLIPRHKVTELLIQTLSLRVNLEAENVMQNIREMAVLSRELLTLDTSDVDTDHLITLVWAAVTSKIRPGVLDQPLDDLIEFLRAAKTLRPDPILEGRIAFAMSLMSRYSMTYVNDDYEEAASTLDEIITYRSSGNSQDKSVAKAQACATGLAMTLAMMRSNAYQTPEHLEEELYRISACSSSSSFKELYHHVLDPGTTANERFRYFGSVEGAEESPGQSIASQLRSLMPEFSHIFEMDDLLSEICNNDDPTTIQEAIERGRSILASSPNADILDTFSSILLKAYLFTKKIEYLNESITVRRQVIKSPRSQIRRFKTLSLLSLSLLFRIHDFPGYRTQDLDETSDLLSRCVSDTRGSFPTRLKLASLWAFTARLTLHPTVTTAYESTLLSMQDTTLFSPTLHLQHTNLVTDDITKQGFPQDYASYWVDQHQLEKAIETLERGRALLWTEMRHLRVSVDQLLEADPDLGRKFGAVNRDLEELTKSVPPSHKLTPDDGTANGLRAVDPFGRLLLKQRGLLKERAKLISQIQALPGFDGFLASPSFDTLRTAALSGPVVIINHSKWRSDILIFLHNMPPSLISTPDDFYERAGALKVKLLGSRQKYGLDSNNYDEALASVLAELYTLVGEAVIDRLRQLQVPEQSRIWWCPTSVFCSLPLHAMGPIPSDDGETRYFLDLYICSYTSTLSALTQSRHHDSGLRSSGRPSIMLVGQSDPSLPTVGGEIQAVQALDTEVTSLISEAATPATVIDGFHTHRFVHFACHGTLEAGKPFEAGFELHGDARLTLLEIVRAHIPTAEFAFLSACHTAEMTEGSVMDEGLHLAAAIQYCGFRSVVGTMWAMWMKMVRIWRRIFTKHCSRIRYEIMEYRITKDPQKHSGLR
jgi:hypothetical protein